MLVVAFMAPPHVQQSGPLVHPSRLHTVLQIRKYMKRLDIVVPHSVRRGRGWVAMPKHLLLKFYRERRAHIIGLRRSLKWAHTPEAHQTFDDIDLKGDRAVFTFWYNYVDDPAVADPLSLPWVAVAGLKSMVAVGGFRAVYLICFQEFKNVPDGVIVKRSVMPADIKHALVALEASWGNRRGIAAVADVARLRACSLSDHAQNVMCDVDTLFVSPYRPPSWLHHWFGTHSINPSSRENANPIRRKFRLRIEYCKVPEDCLKPVSPFAFPRGSLCLAGIVDELNSVVAGLGAAGGAIPLQYDFPMAAIGRHVNRHGLRQGYLPHTVFSAVPYYLKTKALEQSCEGSNEWSMDRLVALPLDTSPIGFNSWWQSTNVDEGPSRR